MADTGATAAPDPAGHPGRDPAHRPPAGTGRVLVLHPGALGDVMQAVPALRALGGLGPVTFAGQARLAALLHATGVVADALVFDTLGLEALFTPDLPAPARLHGFATVVSWFGSGDERFARRLRDLGGRVVVASPTGARGETGPLWRQLAGQVAALGAVGAAPTSPLPVPAEWSGPAREALRRAGVAAGPPLLVVHPGAGGGWKRWSPEGFAEVIARLSRTGAQALVHQGPADREAADRLAALVDPSVARLVEPDLPVLAAALADAGAYLGGDSGVSQLAAALGVPGVVLYPQETRERWEPWNPSALALPMTGDPGQPAEVAARLIGMLAGRPGASRPSSRASP